jgi:DnaK suppressor protein
MKIAMRQGIRNMLFEKRSSLLKSAKNGMRTLLAGEAREILGPGFDEGDMATISQIENMQSRQFGKQIDLIKSIDMALMRLNDGTYDICEECGEKIGDKRLRAVPFTRYCRNCQENFEIGIRTGSWSEVSYR